jgi:hypothetical protein
MTRNQIHSILLSAFAVAASLSAPRPAPAQDAKHRTPPWLQSNNIQWIAKPKSHSPAAPLQTPSPTTPQ